MSDRIKVSVVSGGPGRALLLKWIDPETGERRFKSAKTKNRGDANQKAGLLSKELSEGKYASGRNTLWLDFTLRYTDEVLSGLAVKTRRQVATVFAMVERLLAPKRLGDITGARLSKLAGLLRAEGKSEFTIKNYLAHFRASLRWAVKTRILAAVPEFPVMHRAKAQKSMKGRPISEKEFNGMLDATAAVVLDKRRPDGKEPTPEQVAKDAATVASWKAYLTALWNNGLRLRESLAVYWDRADDRLCVDLSGAFPMLRIPAALQKNNTETLWPIAPEWGDMLLAVPAAERHGPVFRVQAAMDPDTVSKTVSKIGEEAGIIVNRTTKFDRKTGGRREFIKYASAHDLRRSFGFRWADRVDTFKLQELMRHSNIETTRRFYVGRNAQNTAAALWSARDRATGTAPEVAERNTFDNSRPAEQD